MLINLLKTAKHNAEIADYTYFGLKGKADLLIEISQPEELKQIILESHQAKLNYFIIAGGSNIIMTNKKYQGLVIVYRQRHFPLLAESFPKAMIIAKNRNSFEESKIDKTRIKISASIFLADLIKLTVINGLKGLESLSGIPGTVGGAIFGNAGAYGHSISDVVEKVLIFDGKKERWLVKKDCLFSYRDSIFKRKSWAILMVQLKFKLGSSSKLQEFSESLIKKRDEKFSQIKCPGSFFKNILVSNLNKRSLSKIDRLKIIDGKVPAGYLLESIGAKGMRVGGLSVTDYHGNLIVNDGTATYQDVKKLVSILKEKVVEKFGIKLEEEVRYLV